jgi:hypothetical protein
MLPPTTPPTTPTRPKRTPRTNNLEMPSKQFLSTVTQTLVAAERA